MNNLLKQLKTFDKVDLNTLVVFCFLSFLCIFALIFTNNFILFLGILAIVTYFIYQTPQSGFLVLLLTTMVFGEHFSLLPLQIHEAVYKIYLLDFVLIVSFLCWFLQQKVKKVDIKGFLKNKVNLWLIVFWVLIFLNLLISIIFKSSDKSLAMGTFKNYSYLLIYFLVILMFNSKEWILKILKTLFYGGLLLTIFVLYGWLNGKGLWSEVTPGLRYLSGLHTYFITFSIIILFVGIAYRKYIFHKISSLIVFLIQVAGVAGSMFRHLWLGLAIGFLYIFSRLKFVGKQKVIRILFSVILGIAIVSLAVLWFQGLLGQEVNLTNNTFLESVVDRGSTLFQTGYSAESAASWRLSTWKIAFDKFTSNPLIGIGLGQKFYFEHLGFVDLIDIRNIHNDFASLLVQLGLIGFIPFLIFNIYIIKYILNLIKDNKEHELGLILSAFYIITVFGIFFAIYLMFNGTAIFYWTITAMVAVLYQKRRNKGLT
ncbi:MAG: O-antigen ligase family protein [Patescibacteria group bacterium]